MARAVEDRIVRVLPRRGFSLVISSMVSSDEDDGYPSAVTTCSYFRIKMLLKYKMGRVGGRVVECEEEYTSKTYSSGGIKHDLGRSSTYKCSFCHAVYDRDANAAKNIFHKNMQMLG